MRGLHTRKRSRNAAPFKRNVRRRTVRRFKRRGRRGGGFTQTSRQLVGSNPYAFRSKKLRKSAWRRALWAESRFKTHFRTVLSLSDILFSPNNTTSESVYVIPALGTAAGGEFWTTTGGLQDPQFGEVPSWSAGVAANDPISIILRGGRLWCTIGLNAGTFDTCKVRVQLMFAKQQARNVFDNAPSNTIGIPGTAGGYLGTTGINPNGIGYTGGTFRPIGWSLQEAPDYAQYYYPAIVDKSADLKAADSISVYWKIKPVKIDIGPFKDGSMYAPYWAVYFMQDNNSTGTAEGMVMTFGHNMSFAVCDTLT